MSLFVKWCLSLVKGFQLMMWFGAFLCFIVFGLQPDDYQVLVLAIVLVLVTLVTSTFEIFQEGKQSDVMKKLKEMQANTVSVFRNGKLVNIDAAEIVPGDVVRVTGGEKVPADIRIIEVADLKVNNASLTGENVDIKLSNDPKHTELYEAKNIARSGCNFTQGNGLGVVFATGDNTFFGSIASSTTQIKRPPSLLVHEINRLIQVMGYVAGTLGVIFFVLALINGYTLLQAIIFLIGIVVANVPEGLLPQLTVALTITAKRMWTFGVLVTNLDIIETLGAVTAICSDKTGTLTLNRMTVSHLVYDKRISVIRDQTPMMEGDGFQEYDPEDPHFKKVYDNACLNSNAQFLSDEIDVNKR